MSGEDTTIRVVHGLVVMSVGLVKQKGHKDRPSSFKRKSFRELSKRQNCSFWLLVLHFIGPRAKVSLLELQFEAAALWMEEEEQMEDF